MPLGFAFEAKQMSKKEPTVTAHVSPEVLPQPKIETVAEAAVRKRIEENGQKKEAIQELKEKLAVVALPELDEELLEKAVKTAEDALKTAKDLADVAKENLRVAQAQWDEVVLKRDAANKLSAEDLNRQYLESQKKLRYDAAMEAKTRLDAMANAGLLSAEELRALCPAVTPLDRAISDQKRARERKPEVYRRRV